MKNVTAPLENSLTVPQNVKHSYPMTQKRNENIRPRKNMDMDIHSSSMQKATRTSNGLVSKIYRQLMMLNGIKTNSRLKKWAKYVIKHFSKEDIQMANRHMKRCSTSLAIREIQMETTVRYQLTQSKKLPSKKFTNNKCWRGCVWRDGNTPTLLVEV